MKSQDSVQYDLQSVSLPHLVGFPLRLVVGLLEGPLRGLLIPSLLKNAGVADLRRRVVEEPPTYYPMHSVPSPAASGVGVPPDEWPKPAGARGPGFQFVTAADYGRAYREGSTTPEAVTERVLEAMEEADSADPPLCAFIAVDRQDIREQALASAMRHRQGQPLGPLDGVPVAVKDEVDMLPYPTTVGTRFLGRQRAAADATAVARLRAAGALLIGKANMHEIGIGVTGLNPHHGTPRNPYDPAHHTGGSSSGPAAAVAAGLCPMALGADGGGSIRIPSSFCGLVGLKPTFGRVSERGAAPLCWSVAHLGPIAGTTADAALLYAAIAGPDALDPHSCHQPAPNLAGWDRTDLSDLTLGWYPTWFRHATAEVVEACERMLQAFQGLGARLREVAIPALEPARVAHTVTIAAEMTQALGHTYAEHRRDHGLDVRTNLALARGFGARDYIQAQQVRTGMMESLDRALKEVDLILTPATGLAAPAIEPRALAAGESNLSLLVEIMRFSTPANLAGLPAIAFPVGYTAAGLPVGMQAMGRAWDEATLFRLARAAEGLVERLAPRVHFRLLDG